MFECRKHDVNLDTRGDESKDHRAYIPLQMATNWEKRMGFVKAGLYKYRCTMVRMLVLVHGICRQYQSLTVDEGCVDNDGLLVGVLVG